MAWLRKAFAARQSTFCGYLSQCCPVGVLKKVLGVDLTEGGDLCGYWNVLGFSVEQALPWFYRQWCLTGFQKLAVSNNWQEFQLLVEKAILPFAAVFATASINKQLNAFLWVTWKWFGRCHTCVASEMEISGNESNAQTSSLSTSFSRLHEVLLMAAILPLLITGINSRAMPVWNVL